MEENHTITNRRNRKGKPTMKLYAGDTTTESIFLYWNEITLQTNNSFWPNNKEKELTVAPNIRKKTSNYQTILANILHNLAVTAITTNGTCISIVNSRKNKYHKLVAKCSIALSNTHGGTLQTTKNYHTYLNTSTEVLQTLIANSWPSDFVADRYLL